jgi:hypothetical protein
MAPKPSQLRASIYRILDQVLATGIPVEIERRGKLLEIIPAEPSGKLARLKRRDCILGDPMDLVHLDRYDEWP